MNRCLAMLLAGCSAHVAAQQTDAAVTCVPYAAQRLVYDCEIHLSRAGAPLTGAALTVGADMPSMPMAHNVKPVRAVAADAPGAYRARLQLEMAGTWRLKLRVSGATSDEWIYVRHQVGDSRTPHQHQ